MAIKLAEQAGQAPILALLGSLHTLKKVDRNPTLTKKEPYVAEILAARGFNVKSYPQVWLDHACNTRNRLISSDQPEAVELLNIDLIALLNATESKIAADTIDGVILWEC